MSRPAPRVANALGGSASGSHTHPVAMRVRVAVALVIGALSAIACYAFLAAHHGAYPSDFEFWWRGSRLWASGVDPYSMRRGMPAWPLPDPMLYPLPALMLTWPLHWFGLAVAGGLFIGLSAGWLAWALMRDGYWRLWIFASAAFLSSVRYGQWSPLLTAAAVVPTAGFFLVTKPTLGLACFAYRPTWRAVWSGLAIIALSLIIWPAWPVAWLATVRSVIGHRPPILEPFGFVLLLALLRWRQPEGRLLFAMACVPQLLFFYDQLPLGLTARTEREAMALSASGMLAMLAWAVVAAPHPNYVARAAPLVMLGCYLPALIIVLRRPNTGDVPVWMDRVASALTARRVGVRVRVRPAACGDPEVPAPGE